MIKMLEKNEDGSIDVLGEYGYSKYRIDKNETGIMASLAGRLLEYETAMDKENLVSVLNDYFSIYTDTYSYNLTRDKTAFSYGTMTMEDFEEFTEETTTDLADYSNNKTKGFPFALSSTNYCIATYHNRFLLVNHLFSDFAGFRVLYGESPRH